MAGTFTHWMVVESALDRLNTENKNQAKFREILLGYNHFVLLGAVGPDYPYLSELKNNLLKLHSWADRMHYENTGEFVKNGMINLKILSDEDFNVCCSWLYGFVTHLLTDSIIHPVVNAIVGPYVFNSSEHRHCEMIQDTYIFKEIKNLELAYTRYTDLIKMCSDKINKDHLNQAISSFWSKTLEMSHPGGQGKFGTINPDEWHENFLSVISTVANPFPIFRHIGEENNLTYKKTSAITDYERNRFIDAINLPGGKHGNFKQDAFEKAVIEVVSVWGKMSDDLQIDDNQKRNVNISQYIENWNLDTGVDEDKIFFW